MKKNLFFQHSFSVVAQLIFLLILLSTIETSAQVPAWIWATSAGGTSVDYSNGITTDAGDNVFVTGNFDSSSVTFGSTTLTNAGGFDIFVVKYDASGNVLWATSAGGTSGEDGSGISADAGGNVFVTGYFHSPTITFGTTTLTNAGSADIFVVKYDASGNVIWATSSGGIGYDGGYGISTDAGGNVFVTGRFSSPSITFDSTTLTNAGYSDIFVVKYSPSGNLLWATSAGGIGYDVGYGISTDAGGNVFVTGRFSSPSITFGSTTLSYAGSFDIFIVKYSPSGNALWATSAGGTGEDDGYGISTDAAGNMFVTGWFNSPSIIFGSITLTNAGLRDIFVVKYDVSGNVVWAASAGGTNYDAGSGISTDTGGNVFVTGNFDSPSVAFGSTTLSNAGGNDIFVVKYDASGNVLWATSAGGSNDDFGSGISTDASGNVVVVGYFKSSSLAFGSTTLSNAGLSDVFVAKLDNLTGLEENIENDWVSIFPNPATNQLAISTRHFAISVAVYDLMGRLMAAPLHYTPGHDQYGKCMALRVDVSSFSAGIYFVKVTGEKDERIEKFVKE